jgi:tetratricopeptide (TPR) repeat protein
MSAIRRAGLGLSFLALLGSACRAGPRPAPEPTPEEILEDAREAFKGHDYGTAERLYQSLLETASSPRPIPYLRLQVGRCLQAWGSLAQARLEYEMVLASPLDPNAGNDALRENYGDVKPAAQVGLAECYEGESRWEEALAAYVASRDQYPRRHWCGNCQYDRRQKTLEGIARCIRRIEEK